MIGGNLVATLLRPFRRAAEGEPRPGPWPVTNPDGWLPDAWGKYINYWQMGYDPIGGGSSAIVEACVGAYAQTIAMCPGDQWWRDPATGGRERITNTALSRILRAPNEYQSRSDFVLNLVRDLYLEGNTYALAQRNSRFEVTALHPFNPRRSRSYVVPGSTEIFYSLGGNNIIESAMLNSPDPKTPGNIIVPARDVLHIKLEAKASYPLVGIPPLRHAAIAVAAQNAIGSQLINFFANMSRPSSVLSTDLSLTADQVTELRARWNEQSKGLAVGGTPILTSGLKYNNITVSAKDADLVASLKMSQDEVCMVFGVPPAILGMTDRSSFNTTEALMQFWLARGLGFAINHVETAFDQFFGLKGWPDDYVEFDTAALLRSQFRDRIEGLARGVQTAIFSPNEARRFEDLPDAAYGQEPRVQQQVVPLSAWAKVPPATPAPAAPAAPPPAAPAAGGKGLDEKAALAALRKHVGETRNAA